jgi:hypothetical protein
MWEGVVATKIRLPQAKEDSKELSGEEGKLADIKTDAVLDADNGSDGLLGRPDTFVETNKGDGYDLDGALDVRGGVNTGDKLENDNDNDGIRLDVRGGVNTGDKLENDNDNDGIRGEKPDANAEMRVAQNTESFDWNNEFSGVEASGLVQTNEHRLAEGNDLTGAFDQSFADGPAPNDLVGLQDRPVADSSEAAGLVQTNEHRLAEGNDLTEATAQVDSSLVSAVDLINDAMAQNLNDTNAADIENALPENVVVDTVRPEDFI